MIGLKYESIVAGASIVMVSVPIHLTVQVINKLPNLDKDTILVDIASIKQQPLDAMLAAHDDQYWGFTQCLVLILVVLQSRSLPIVISWCWILSMVP